jgi:hypothetical protein
MTADLPQSRLHLGNALSKIVGPRSVTFELSAEPFIIELRATTADATAVAVTPD